LLNEHVLPGEWDGGLAGEFLGRGESVFFVACKPHSLTLFCRRAGLRLGSAAPFSVWG
jgi:hypothetical protein